MTGSHIIPQFYLKQFGTPSQMGPDKPWRIWVYERQQAPDERATTVQGRKNGYFAFTKPDAGADESLEKDLADREDDCNDILASAKSFLFDWSLNHRNKLAFYMGMLHSRATQRREFTVSNWTRIIGEYCELIKDEQYIADLTAEYQTRFPHENVTTDAIRNRLAELANAFQKPEAAKNVFVRDVLNHAELIKQALLNKPWQLWIAPAGAEFITSDNPVISFVPLRNGEFHPGHGFAKPETVIAFPLAPDVCLVIGVPGPYPVMRVNKDVQTLTKLNEVLIMLCDRYVYSKTLSEEIKKSVDQSAGMARYGLSAFVRVGEERPSVKDFFRRNLRLPSSEYAGNAKISQTSQDQKL